MELSAAEEARGDTGGEIGGETGEVVDEGDMGGDDAFEEGTERGAGGDAREKIPGSFEPTLVPVERARLRVDELASGRDGISRASIEGMVGVRSR